MGAVLTCNEERCACRVQTGQIEKRLIRTYATSIGWRKGSSKTDGGIGKRGDLCPDCVPVEAERVAKKIAEREERKKVRREAKEKKLAPLRGEVAPAELST